MAASGVVPRVDLPPFQTLLDAHGRDVHRFLIATLGVIDADDAYQETWIAALRAYPRLKSAENLRGWLLKIAHNKAIDAIRATQRRALPVGDDLPETPAYDRPGSDVFGGDGGLGLAVAELAPKQRTAIALRFIVDAPYDEIAAAMGTSADAARRNVHEGLKKLRKEPLDA